MVIHSIPEINVYGDNAFVNKNSAKPDTTPGKNPENSYEYDYWDHVDYVIEKAAEKGIYMALVAVWGSVVKNGFFDTEKAEIYGNWLAGRYKDKPNIIWVNGGDIRGSDRMEIWNVLGKAINKTDNDHLITFHPFGRTQSSNWFHNEDWLDFNMFQ